MTNFPTIQYHSLKDILNVLQEDEQQEDMHVYFKKEIISENPFPYPFRSDNNGVMLLTRGKLKMQIDFEEYLIQENDVVFFSPKSIIHIIKIIEDVQCISIVFSDDFTLKTLWNYSDINVIRFFSEKTISVIPLSIKKREIFYQLAANLYRLNSGDEEYYKKERILHYFNALVLEMMAFYRVEMKDVETKSSRKQALLKEFLHYLHQYSRKERQVQFYADKLCVTPDYLTKILKEASRMTTKEIIEEAVIMEARNLLMDDSLTIAQIADMLNFSDQSFFGKFFKKKMKISPNFFRNQYKK